MRGENRIEDTDTPRSEESRDHTERAHLLLTKLNPPRLRSDIVPRPQIIERLERDARRPLTLISAPAGYGKSTIAAQWLESSALPAVWLSLDEGDNDVRTFLTYFVAAVRQHVPRGCRSTNDLLGAAELPPPSVLANALANDLERLCEPFILALDDYHCIEDPQIHELLNRLLEYPPRSLNLAILTRRDPPLRITTMRASGLAMEIREADLQFSAEETRVVFREMGDVTLEPEAMATIMNQLEGWIVGLRMVCMGLHRHGNPRTYLAGLKGDNAQIQEYLVQQVLSMQSPALHACLLNTSILDRFCAPLCDVLCTPAGDGESDGPSLGGERFLRPLGDANLFTVSLSADGEWVRYHHFFQQLLQDQLRRQRSQEKIAALNRRACGWLESEGLIDEALHHAHAAQDHALVADIVERQWRAELDNDRWYVVQRWVDGLPLELRRQRPQILIAEGCVAFEHYNVTQLATLIDQVRSLVDIRKARPPWAGEYYFFRGLVEYYSGRGDTCLKHLEQAHDLLTGEKSRIHGDVELHLGLARAMTGKKDLAIERLNELLALAGSTEAIYRSRLIAGLFFVRYLSGDQIQARTEARRLRTLAKRSGIAYTKGWSDYMEACTYLLANRLSEAAEGFSVVAGQRYVLNSRPAVDAIAGLALTRQLMHQDDAAREALYLLWEFSEQHHDPVHLSIANSCRARLALLRGELDWALQWACSFDAMPAAVELAMWLEVPVLTRARVLIADASTAHLALAADLLRTVRQQAEACCYVPQMIEAQVLQSLALEKQGSTVEALEVLNEAVELAEPGGWIRPFIEIGPTMAGMLARLPDQQRETRFVTQIRSNFGVAKVGLTPVGGTGLVQQPLVEALTNREHDVLVLLSQRLSDKEIAAQLSISVATVRTHLKHLYAKLGVQNRRQAVLESKELGIL